MFSDIYQGDIVADEWFKTVHGIPGARSERSVVEDEKDDTRAFRSKKVSNEL